MRTETLNYIKVSEIESALEALWEKHSNTNTIRASLFNLVIYVKKDLREEYLSQLAKNMIRKYPCRMIVITEFENTGEDYLRTYVSDMLPEEGSSIFCDLINFEVSGSYRERIPFVVLPHLLADKPVYLLWGDDPLKNDPISIKLENRATRTIFDSDSTQNLEDFASMVLKHQEKVFCDIGDLNWARCSPWRNLFAHSFNSAQALHCLEDAKDIHIVFNGSETKDLAHTRIQSMYFQGWLATRLGWKCDTVLSTKDDLCFKYKTNQGLTNLTLSAGSKSDLPSGRILTVDIESHGSEKISFIRSKKNVNKISMHHCSNAICDMPVYHLFNKEMVGRSMKDEVYSQGTDPSFMKVLEFIISCKKGMISNGK